MSLAFRKEINIIVSGHYYFVVKEVIKLIGSTFNLYIDMKSFDWHRRPSNIEVVLYQWGTEVN